MAITPDKRRFQKTQIGVTRADGGGANMWDNVSQLASTIHKNEFEINAEKAKQSGYDLASEIDRANIVTLDPDTGKPVALTLPQGFGRIQEATYNDVIYKRFQNHMKDEMLNVSSDIAKRANYNPSVYAKNMGDYLDSMDKASSGRYNGVIADYGFDIISKTTDNLRARAQSAAISSAKKAATLNADAAQEAVLNTAALASQATYSYDPRGETQRVPGMSDADFGGGEIDYRRSVEEFHVTINEEFAITGDAEKYVKRKKALTESLGVVSFSFVNDSFNDLTDFGRAAVEQAVDNRLFVDQVSDPNLRAHILMMHRFLPDEDRRKYVAQLGRSDKYMDAKEAAMLAAQKARLVAGINNVDSAVSALVDSGAGADAHEAAVDVIDSHIVSILSALPLERVESVVNEIKNSLVLGRSPIDASSPEVADLLRKLENVSYAQKKKILSRLDPEKDALTYHATLAATERAELLKQHISYLHKVDASINVMVANANGQPFSDEERRRIENYASTLNKVFLDDGLVNQLGADDITKLYKILGGVAVDDNQQDANKTALALQISKNEAAAKAVFDLEMLNAQKLEASGIVDANPAEAISIITQSLQRIASDRAFTTSNRNTVHGALTSLMAKAVKNDEANAEVHRVNIAEGYIKALGSSAYIGPLAADIMYGQAMVEIEKVTDADVRNSMTADANGIYNEAVMSSFVSTVVNAGVNLAGMEPARFVSIVKSLTTDGEPIIGDMTDEEKLTFNILEGMVDSLKGETDSKVATWVSGVISIQGNEHSILQKEISIKASTRAVAAGRGTEKDKETVVASLPAPVNAIKPAELFDAEGNPTDLFGEVGTMLQLGFAPLGIQNDILAVASGDVTDPATRYAVIKIINGNPELASLYVKDAGELERLRNSVFRFTDGEDIYSAFTPGTFERAKKFLDETYPSDTTTLTPYMREYILNIASLYEAPTKEKVEGYIKSRMPPDDPRVLNGRTERAGPNSFVSAMTPFFSAQSYGMSGSIFSSPLSNRERYDRNIAINNMLVNLFPEMADLNKVPLDESLNPMPSAISFFSGAVVARRSRIVWGLDYNPRSGAYAVVSFDEFGKQNKILNKDGTPLEVYDKDFVSPEESRSELPGIYFMRFVQMAASDPATATRAFGDNAATSMFYADIINRRGVPKPAQYSNPKTQGLSDAAWMAQALGSHPTMFEDPALAALLRQRIREGYILSNEGRTGISDAMEFYLAGGLTLEDYKADKAAGWIRPNDAAALQKGWVRP